MFQWNYLNIKTKMYDDSCNWLNGGALLLLLFIKIEIVFSLYVFFFNANVFLNDYFDSPHWLFTTVFLLFSAFITCVIRCICQCWKLCTMYTFEIKCVLFCSAIITVETVNILRFVFGLHETNAFIRNSPSEVQICCILTL